MRQLDSLKQQQHTQAASVADVTAQVAQLQAELTNSPKNTSPGALQNNTQLSQLHTLVEKLQADVSGLTAMPGDAQIEADIAALQAQVSQLQNEAPTASSLAAVQEEVGVIRGDIAQLQDSQADFKKAADRIAALDDKFTELALASGCPQRTRHGVVAAASRNE